jgi:hypothetical protein
MNEARSLGNFVNITASPSTYLSPPTSSSFSLTPTPDFLHFFLPIAVAALSKARTVFARSNTEVVGSNPTEVWMFVCVFSVST